MTVGVAEAGTRESITEGENGFLVAADEELFARKIDQVLADRERLEKMALIARETVERKWSMESAVLRLESLLERVATTAPEGAGRPDGR